MGIVILASLIVLGGMYVIQYEHAPFYERFNVLLVGLGMYVAAIVLYLS